VFFFLNLIETVFETDLFLFFFLIDDKCGKTSLILAYSRGEFVEQYLFTVFETYVLNVQTEEGIRVELIVWDTAGQEEYERLRPMSYSESDVILLCYSVDNYDSFTSVRDKWHPEVRYFTPQTPIILVANKKDLRNNAKQIEKKPYESRLNISFNQGEELAKRIGAAHFVECSAKIMDGISKVFKLAAQSALRKDSITQKHKCILL
jgi:Ras family protein A